MTTFRSEEGLVGLVALGVIPWIAWTVQRGLREARLPIGRTYVHRAERPGVFNALLVFYLLSALLMAAIVADYMLGFEILRKP
jgi:hypothetical protein